jgi:ABC-2 type transport system ATP-binding protein
MAAIEVEHLVKRYRGTKHNAVDDISFEVAEGELFCMLGPNGAGKTTTISILTTTLEQTAGVVRIAGRSVTSDQAGVRKEIGVVFQQPALDQNLTAEENLRLHAVLYGMYTWRPSHRMMPGAYRAHVQEVAGILGMTDQLGQPIRKLSGGQRRRLEIVRALMHRPRVLFLDEPTAGLDPQSRRSLWAYLAVARVRLGTTILLTTHYLAEAEPADAACVLVAGSIVDRGTPAELKQRHGAQSLEDAYLTLVDEGLRPDHEPRPENEPRPDPEPRPDHEPPRHHHDPRPDDELARRQDQQRHQEQQGHEEPRNQEQQCDQD